MPTLSNGSSPRRQGAHFSSPVPEGQAQEEQTQQVQSQQEQIKQPSVEATGSLPALTGGKLSSRSAQVTHMAKNKQVKHRDKKASKRSRIFATLIAFIMVAALGIFVWKVVLPELSRSNSDTQEITAGQQVTVTIPDGAGAQEVAKILFENKIIATKSEFLNQVKRQDAEQKIKSGIYVITTGTKPADIVHLLISGPNAPGSGFVVPEGYTVSQVADLVQEYFGISRDDFLNQAKASNYVADYPFLAGAVDANDSLEGYLFPKTYTFTESNVTADTVIRAMLDQFETETADLNLDAARITLNKRYNLNLTNEQIITMASIIEREALTDEDRPKVASVFYNRLYDDMYLQSDATLAYSLGREATAEELSSMTSDPYNTYAFKGLTPTPICSPGYASIKAAMDPAATNYYYFWITSDEHVFSETYDEHQQAIENAREHEAASKQQLMSMSLIKATQYVSAVEYISIEDLVQQGIKLVLLDRDNTCVPRDTKMVPPEVSAWFEKAHAAGLTLCLISNNIHLNEVQHSAHELGIEGEGFACKPLPRALTAAMKRFSATKEQTVMVGDQIFTDVIAGNLAGVATILVKPQSTEDLWYTNIIRHAERRILKNVTFTS